MSQEQTLLADLTPCWGRALAKHGIGDTVDLNTSRSADDQVRQACFLTPLNVNNSAGVAEVHTRREVSSGCISGTTFVVDL
jgi:hypothetical protein